MWWSCRLCCCDRSYFAALLSMFCFCFFLFFNDPATPEIYPLSLHAALPISIVAEGRRKRSWNPRPGGRSRTEIRARVARSEEHPSELQSPCNLVCRLLL